MLKKFLDLISPGAFQFSICILMVLFSLLYRLLNMPAPAELINSFEHLFETYGLWVVFFSALIEGIFLVGMYFPGSFAIVLAVYFLGKTPNNLFYIGCISYTSFLISNIINYFLGRYGYYRLLLLISNKGIMNRMQALMQKYGNSTFFITGVLPNFFAITSVYAGICKMNFRKVIILQLVSLAFWIIIWVIIGSLLVNRINIQDENQSYYIICLFFLWGVFLVVKEKTFKRCVY
ncbi:MAG: DedA family protein [Ignavibacteria bacterium]